MDLMYEKSQNRHEMSQNVFTRIMLQFLDAGTFSGGREVTQTHHLSTIWIMSTANLQEALADAAIHAARKPRPTIIRDRKMSKFFV